MKKNLFTGLILSVFALVCGLLLAGVNYFTSPIIEARQNEEINESLEIVYPLLDTSIHNVTKIENGNVDSAYLITLKSSGDKVAVIYVVSSTGYAGDIQMMIAVDSSFEVTGYKVLVTNETKGDITTHDFGMIGESSVNSDTFDALAGSTFSSNAVKDCFTIALAQARVDLV